MGPLGIALWLVTPEQKVLLQPKRFEKFGIEIFQPIEAWVGSNERVEDKIKRLIQEELGETFAAQCSFRRFSPIKKNVFPIVGEGMATRYHFLYPITDQQSAIISASGKFRLIGKEDLSKLKALNDRQKDPKENIVLFKENQEILLGILSR